MNELFNFFSATIGFASSIVLFWLFLLPFFIQLPKAILWFVKRRITFFGVMIYALVSGGGFLVSALLFIALYYLFPTIIENRFFVVGVIAGNIWQVVLSLKKRGINIRYYKFLQNAVDFATKEQKEITLNIVADLIALKIIKLSEQPTSLPKKTELTDLLIKFPLDKYDLLPFFCKG